MLVPGALHRAIGLYIDSVDRAAIVAAVRSGQALGVTTNPTLLQQAGVESYERWARDLIAEIPVRPLSLEVMSEEPREIVRQARALARWGEHVYVKVPLCTSIGTSNAAVIRDLTQDGIKVNVTAVLSLGQVYDALGALAGHVPSIISVFAGRIADTGRDPVPVMRAAAEMVRSSGWSEAGYARLLWASTREVLNVYQANAAGVDLITVPPEILKKMSMLGRDLDDLARETSAQFARDAALAGYTVN